MEQGEGPAQHRAPSSSRQAAQASAAHQAPARPAPLTQAPVVTEDAAPAPAPAASAARVAPPVSRAQPALHAAAGIPEEPEASRAVKSDAAGASANPVAQHALAHAAQHAAPMVPPAAEPEPQLESESRRKAPAAPAAAKAPRRLDDLDLAHDFGDRPTRDDDGSPDARHPHRRAEHHVRDVFDVIAGLAPPPPAPTLATAPKLAPVAEARGSAGTAKVATQTPSEDAAGERREGERSATVPTRTGFEPPAQPMPALPLPLLADAPAAPTQGPLAPPPLPPELAGLPEDPGLSVSIMKQAAHLTIAGDNGNALELHLRMLPEGADIRATGELAPLVHSRASELGHVLAAEGVTLGRFELGNGGPGAQNDSARRDNNPNTFEREPMDRLTNPRAPSGPSPSDESDGVPSLGRASRIHVKA
jgi:hypothetical protein